MKTENVAAPAAVPGAVPRADKEIYICLFLKM